MDAVNAVDTVNGTIEATNADNAENTPSEAITPPSSKKTVVKVTDVVYLDEMFDQEYIPDGKSSYTNLGHSIEDKFDLKGKNRRMKRLNNKKKDKQRKDRYRD